MSNLLRALAWLLAFALMFANTSCDLDKLSKDDSSEDGKKKKKKKKKKGSDDEDDDDDDNDDDNDDDKPKKRSLSADGPSKAAVSTTTSLIKYMPSNCPKGRIYLDASKAFSAADSKQILRDVMSKLTKTTKSEDAKKAVKMLEDAGFDAGKSIRELAMCMGHNDNNAIGVGLTVKDPLGLIVKIANATGGDAKLETKGSTKVLATKDGMGIVQPADGVLMLGPTALLQGASGEVAFGPARGLAAYGWIPVDANSNIEAKVTDAGSDLKLWGGMKMSAEDAATMKKDPKVFTDAIRKDALKSAAELRNTPYKFLEARVKSATFKTEGDKLVATMTLPRSDIAELLRAGATELGVQVGGGSGAPMQPRAGSAAATAGGTDPLDEMLKMLKNRKK